MDNSEKSQDANSESLLKVINKLQNLKKNIHVHVNNAVLF